MNKLSGGELILIYISNTYSLRVLNCLLENGIFNKVNLIVLYRKKSIVINLDVKTFEIPMFDYGEMNNLIDKFLIRRCSSKIISNLVGNEKYILIIPHNDNFMFFSLKNSPNCTFYYYIEEGDVSLLEFNGDNNIRKSTVSLMFDKLLNIKNKFRYFDICDKKFRKHIGFFKPINLFGESFEIITNTKLSNNIKSDYNNQKTNVLFLEKDFFKFPIDIEDKLKKMLLIIGCDFNIYLKPHPNINQENKLLLGKVIEKINESNVFNLSRLDENLVIDDLMKDYSNSSFYSEYSSVIIELLQFRKKISVFVPEEVINDQKIASIISNLKSFSQKNKLNSYLDFIYI